MSPARGHGIDYALIRIDTIGKIDIHIMEEVRAKSIEIIGATTVEQRYPGITSSGHTSAVWASSRAHVIIVLF
jgi:hypothetical protein